MKLFLKKHKYFLMMLLVLGIGVFVMFLPSLIKGEFFIGGGDVKTQWYPFYILNRRTTISSLKDHTLPFYSFVLFLGNNIWASKSSYGLFDIYNILTYVLDKNYFFIYDLQCLIKIIVSGISSYLLIDYIYKNKKVSFIAGLCYGLSSFAIYFTSQPGFLSFYSFVPLYILGMEKYLKENKKYLFIIMVFILLITNYYLFYALSLFSPIYFIYRYFNINNSLKGVIKSALKLIVFYIIGVLLSAIVIVPAFLYVIQNERVGGLNSSLTYADLSIYFHLFISSLVPSHDYIYGNNVFEQNAHTLKEICLYCGTLITLIVPQIFTEREFKYKKSTLIVYGIMIVSLFIPLIGGIINGFSEPCFRWLFIFILFNIITASRYLNNLDLINKKNLLFSLIIEIVIIVTMFVLCLIYKKYSIRDYKMQSLIFVVTIIFMVLNYLFISKNKSFFIVICIVELCAFSCFYGYKSLVTAINKEDIEMVTSVLADNDDYHNLRNYLNTLDANNTNEYFRIYVPYDSLYWSFSHDLGIIYNINGLMTYDSTYSQSFNKMRSLNYDEIVDVIDWEFNIQDINIMNFLSTKYSITTSIDEIPFEDYEIIIDAYRGSLIIAKNLNYRSIASTYDKSITYEELKVKYNNDTSLLNEYVVIDKEINVGSDDSICEDITYYDNYFSCNLYTSEDGFAVIGFPYDEGWKIIVNGEEIEYYECNGGMIGFSIVSGNNNIEMYFVPSGFKIGFVLSIVGFLSFIAIIIFDKKKTKTLI